jgi:thiol-disulfide isomerase/thioredoxin
VLVVVVVMAIVGYKVLSAGQGEASVQQVSAEASAQGSTQGSAQSQKETGPQLADYDATVYDESDEPVKLSAIAAGKPLVINFWATWCPYCVEELPDFQKVYQDYGDRVSFAFVDSTDGRRETKEGAQAWLAENGYADLPVYYDKDLDATAAFGARSLPTTAIVTADGEILVVQPGKFDATRLRGALDTLVSS